MLDVSPTISDSNRNGDTWGGPKRTRKIDEEKQPSTSSQASIVSPFEVDQKSAPGTPSKLLLLPENTYDEDKSAEVKISMGASLVWLLFTSVYISIISDVLINSIEDFAAKCKLSEVFTAAIILPIFSNFAEQASSVYFAYQNKMDLCIAITIGSAIQIALQVIPGCVLYGWAADKHMTLFFHGYETAVLLISVLTVSCVLQGGTTNWLVGAFLLGIYFIVASGFWVHEIENITISTDDN
eukprot:CAMPEP_0113298310 /NCGR_PEP_ID=MMETSP0010_2-20120614/810_1 /TAXON_ID=216773 ORGANISM="Corethron hystrix, Strain 308" /NCGR_SAMPLE_ID=MMETSP0010_2 /ASSEMBLY_ACC=CAM_ASM_000155 /LENGTH=239 /DNA_ID=CAMNT_0000151347 /DNA_START=917 /DNA_END=1636 /DNA_ORIENTATION=- /assembly_acc=CAM_ASM_000155